MTEGDDESVDTVVNPGGQLDPEVLHQLVAAGLAVPEVARRLGVSRATVNSWLRRYSITADAPLVTQDELVTAWRAGAAVAVLARGAGLSEAAVRERMVAAAVLRLPPRYFVVGSPDDPLPKELLREWYVRQGFSAGQVAALTDTTHRQVRYRLNLYGLSRARLGPPAPRRYHVPAALLRRLYIDEQLSYSQIAARTGVSAEAVRRLVDAAGITRRSSGQAGADGQLPLDADRLRQLYVVDGLTLAQIAGRLGHLTSAGNPAVHRVRAALRSAGVSSPRGLNWSDRLLQTGDGVAGDGRDSGADVDDTVLRRLYLDEGLTVEQVADQLGWRTPAGQPATTSTRARLLAAGVTLRRRGPPARR